MVELSAKEELERSLDAALGARAVAEKTAAVARADAEAARGSTGAAVAKASASAEAGAAVALASQKRSFEGQLRAMEVRGV